MSTVDRTKNKWKLVKMWVVLKAKVNKPYNKQWNAHTTLHMDIQEYGDTIEEAYNNLTDRICASDFLYSKLEKMPSFNDIQERGSKK